MTLPSVVATKALEDEIVAILMPAVRAWSGQARASILEAYGAARDQIVRDDASSMLSAVLASAEADGRRVVLAQTDKLGRWVVRVERVHRARWISAVKSATGVEIAPYLILEDVQAALDLAIADNVSLIKGLSDRTRERVEGIIWRGLVNRTSKRNMARELSEALARTQRQADRVGRDQMAKLSGVLDRLRQEQLGVDRYRWSTRGDDRVRPEHVKRDDKVFLWSKPPEGGHPGQAINCRCSALAVVNID